MNSPTAYKDIEKTTISLEVLHKITRLTTLSVQGVNRMASTRGRLNQLFDQVESQGVKIVLRDNQVFADVYVVLMSDMNVRDIAREIQERVSRAIIEMVGMDVGGVNVHIMDIDFNA